MKVVEGWREANQHTERGDIVHEHSDLAGYEVAKGSLLWRALPIWSERLGLNGKCDIVEVQLVPGSPAPTRDSNPRLQQPQSLLPVEFKLGRRRAWINDDAQLCAQALCLEEMFGIPVPHGAIFHADSKRRRPVEFTPELRQTTEEAVRALRDLLEAGGPSGNARAPGRLPLAVLKPACEECSLFKICLPQLSGRGGASERAFRALFQPHPARSSD